jgi:P-type Ca2+ transporter type 2B
VGITIIVVAVPEGLPLAVIISLAYSVRKMLEEKNFVKKLAACEIMGGANNICSDKTGTLTKNEMTLVEIWQGKQITLNVEEKKYNMSDIIPNQQVADLFFQGTACNTTGDLKFSNATDLAILKFLHKAGLNFEEKRNYHLPEGFTWFQFTSKRKSMGTILEKIQDNEFGYSKWLIVKGAVEMVLRNCSHYLEQDGSKHLITEEKNKQLTDMIAKFTDVSLRCILIAYKDLQPGEGGADHDNMHIDKIFR